MNDNPHLMAIIDSKMAQVRSSLQNADAARAGDLLAQVKIYAAALDTRTPAIPGGVARHGHR